MEIDLTLYHGLDGTLEHGSSLILGNICIKIMHTYIHTCYIHKLYIFQRGHQIVEKLRLL